MHCGINGHVLTQKYVTRTFSLQKAAVHDWVTETLFCLFSPQEADSLTKSLAEHSFTKTQTKNTPFKKCKIGPKHFNCDYEKSQILQCSSCCSTLSVKLPFTSPEVHVTWSFFLSAICIRNDKSSCWEAKFCLPERQTPGSWRLKAQFAHCLH